MVFPGHRRHGAVRSHPAGYFHRLFALSDLHGDVETAVVALSSLGQAQVDSWRMPLSGSVLSEIGLIGDGDSPLALSVIDEGGYPVCTLPPGIAPGLCRFTPARNGFFVVTVQNAGAVENSYRLIGN